MNLKLPDKITVFGIDQTVITDRMDAPNDCGEYDFKAKRIRISQDVAESGQVDLLFHEVGELANMALELGLTHKQICAISVAFYDFVVNNIDRMVERE